MSLGTAIREKLIKKRNSRGLFLLSNGVFLLLGVFSSVSFSDLSPIKFSTTWIAIGGSVLLLLLGACVFVYYHLQSRKFA